jgi:Flp pilus assembly protein TadG
MHDAQRTVQIASGRTKERGQAMVEFALVLPILCLILFAIVEFGMAFWRYQQVSAAASEGARRAAVSRTYADRTSRAVTAAKDASPNLSPSQMNVTVSSAWTAGSPVTVTVTYPQKITVMGVTLYNGSLTGKRTMRVEQ